MLALSHRVSIDLKVYSGIVPFRHFMIDDFPQSHQPRTRTEFMRIKLYVH